MTGLCLWPVSGDLKQIKFDRLYIFKLKVPSRISFWILFYRVEEFDMYIVS